MPKIANGNIHTYIKEGLPWRLSQVRHFETKELLHKVIMHQFVYYFHSLCYIFTMFQVQDAKNNLQMAIKKISEALSIETFTTGMQINEVVQLNP